MDYLEDSFKQSSHGVSKTSAISQFLLTMNKYYIAWARQSTLATLLLLFWLWSSKVIKKIYRLYNAQVLNLHRSSTGNKISIYFFDQISMWKEILHRLGVTVVSSEDRWPNEDRGGRYEGYQGIRFRWKESGFVGRNQVLDGCVVNMARWLWRESGNVRVAYIVGWG